MEVIPSHRINFIVPDFNLTDTQQNFIREKLEVNYVANLDNEEFLELNNHKVLLSNYICIMYGNNQHGERETYYLRYIGICQMRTKVRYLIQLFQPAQFMWVKDTHILRREVFGFMDRTSMLRTTFLFDPVSNAIYRLQKLRYWLDLPYLDDLNSGIQLRDTKQTYSFITRKRKKVICCELEQKLQNLLKSIDGFN